ncbi:MAG TPA: tRNA pseudouridine(55) synthase TruB [Verrucomicrobiae bacterium]|jgi:tRNA pseudouridine55 synthase|nr:tRNA pseudouridine(55) synthase TruB [Verrucomicrobiae bacterium]
MNFKQEALVNGIILVDKPRDWTSHDVCAFIRKRFHVKKVGHAGTLDPLATGLLVILLGKATKQSIVFTGCDKEYEGVMELGVQTDSHDRLGKVIKECEVGEISDQALLDKAKEFTGEIIQVPPMVSALKHKGVRLYKLARQGQEVPREGRPVMVHTFQIRKREGKFVPFLVQVSKGTYVRTLVNDFGQSLGCLGTLAELRRLRSGQFDVSKSTTIDELRNLTPQDFAAKVLPMSTLKTYAYSQ